jgi:transposase
MSDDYQRIEVITGTARRRRWSVEEKLRIVEETFASGETISSVARRNGVAANLLYRWRRLMTEGGTIAVQADDDVVALSEIKHLQSQIRELERQLGRKTMEAEILREALAKAQAKKPGLHVLSPWKDDGR